MDTKILEAIFKIPASSGNEKEISNFVCSQLSKHEIKFFKDKEGNIFNIENNGLPLLNAHLDTVQGPIDEKLAKFVKLRGNILSGYGVIGGDDKCGIFAVLTFACMRKCNFVFTTGEETGLHGIKHFMSYADLSHIPYGIVLDRRGKEDIICAKNGYGTYEFDKILSEVGKVFGFSSANGLYSDANMICDQISCANLSVGYWNPHSKDEFVNIVELKNAMNFTYAILKNVKDFFAPPKKKPVVTAVPVTTTAATINGRDGVYNFYQACNICGQIRKSLYISAINDFICIDCLKEIRKEILVNEDLILDKKDKENEVEEILNALEEDKKSEQEQLNIDFANRMMNEVSENELVENIIPEHHSNPNDFPLATEDEI
jgi:tripeptide aminopeptidase